MLRTLIRASLYVATLLLFFAPSFFGQSSHHVHASGGVAVIVSGNVSNATLGTTFVDAQVSGMPGSLTGQGFDTAPTGSGVSRAPGNPVFCRFPLTGSLAGGIISLSGTATQSSVSGEIGTPVQFVVNSGTGSIIWTFGTDVFTGSGSVKITSTGS